MHSLSTFCALAFETGRLTPLPDRRQVPDRRKTGRGGRRLEDAESVAHVAAAIDVLHHEHAVRDDQPQH